MTEPILLSPDNEYNDSDETMTDEIYNPTLNQQQTESDYPYIDLRDVEEPVELQGIEQLPLQRTKFYQYQIQDDSYEPLDDEHPDEDGQVEMFGEGQPDFIDVEDNEIFDRHGRMDVKKPGPFFEASPNNFYLDKLTYKYDTEDNKTSTNEDDAGQQEYEFPMSTSNKAKRVMTSADLNTEQQQDLKDYVHIALNNK